MYVEDRKGLPATVLPGAFRALRERKWDGCHNPDRDGQKGVIDFEFGIGTPDHHIAIRFDDGECIGFPPNFVQL